MKLSLLSDALRISYPRSVSTAQKKSGWIKKGSEFIGSFPKNLRIAGKC